MFEDPFNTNLCDIEKVGDNVESVNTYYLDGGAHLNDEERVGVVELENSNEEMIYQTLSFDIRDARCLIICA